MGRAEKYANVLEEDMKNNKEVILSSTREIKFKDIHDEMEELTKEPTKEIVIRKKENDIEKEKSTDPIPTHEMANRILNLPSGGEKYYFRPQPQLNEYIDENGYFVKPDDWDDIESIELPRNIDNMYFLYKVKKEISTFKKS